MSLSPFLRSPFTDLTGGIHSHQMLGRCQKEESRYMECLEAYGLERGKVKCAHLFDDFHECQTSMKQYKRFVMLGRCQREEMAMMDCLEAYGLDRGLVKCNYLVDDFRECHTNMKQFKRFYQHGVMQMNKTSVRHIQLPAYYRLIRDKHQYIMHTRQALAVGKGTERLPDSFRRRPLTPSTPTQEESVDKDWASGNLTYKAKYNAIKHSIIEPWSEFEEIAVTPQVNYTLWSTELKEGSPIMWRRGETFPRHDVVQVNKTYEIKKDFHPNEDPSVLDGRFTWNTNGDADVCFDVVNSCEKSHLVHKKVWPNNSKEPYVVFDKLPVEDDCIIHVIGLYGTTKLTYRTPSCYQDNCVPPEIEPEMPGNITIAAIEDLFDSWEVHVSWAKPDLLPDSYRVTLIIDGEETQILTLPGDATETVFRNVTSNKKWGFFNVEIKSKLGNKTATTSRAAQFLDTAEDAARDEDQAGGAGVAAVGAGCAAAAALALLCRCRRRRDHLPVPSYKPDDKPLKEGDTDVLEVWSETEDRWEVRADKLVLHEVIGEGAFGVVRRATLAPHSLLVAVKMLKGNQIISFRDGADEERGRAPAPCELGRLLHREEAAHYCGVLQSGGLAQLLKVRGPFFDIRWRLSIG
ncbi:unnamed protein product [Spodoptera exigua]|nr:unnamed protein product [Spodoptera exigua]